MWKRQIVEEYQSVSIPDNSQNETDSRGLTLRGNLWTNWFPLSLIFILLCPSGLLLFSHCSAICVSFDAGCATTALLTFDSHYLSSHKIINKEMKFIQNQFSWNNLKDRFESQKRQLPIMAFDIATKLLLTSGSENRLLSGLLSSDWKCQRKETVGDI